MVNLHGVSRFIRNDLLIVPRQPDQEFDAVKKRRVISLAEVGRTDFRVVQ